MAYKLYKNEKGQRHRIGGPAYINNDTEIWCMNGLYHRVNGPAYIEDDYQQWLINGKVTNIDNYINDEIKDCIYGI